MPSYSSYPAECPFKKEHSRGTWVAQSVKRPTLGFGSGHDLRVHEFSQFVSSSPSSGSVLTVLSLLGILSLLLSLCPYLSTRSLSLSQSK